MTDSRSTPDEILEAEQSLRARMDSAQPGLHVARRRLQRDEADFDVTYVALPNAVVTALHDAWEAGAPDRTIVSVVKRMFDGQDGELTALPHPPIREAPEHQEHQ